MKVKEQDITAIMAKVLENEEAAKSLDWDLSLKSQDIDSLDRITFFFEVANYYKILIESEDLDEIKTLNDFKKYLEKK